MNSASSMPTPMPIMAAISGANVGTTRRCVTNSKSAMPIAKPKSAVMIGRPMATTDPKVSRMMRIAAVMPMPSLGPGAAVITVEMGSPPKATANPRCAAASAAVVTALTALAGRRSDVVLNCTTA
jgi:hypothetical protein